MQASFVNPFIFIAHEPHIADLHDFLNDKSLAGLKKKGDSWDLIKQVKDMKVTVGVELWSLDSEDSPPAA